MHVRICFSSLRPFVLNIVRPFTVPAIKFELVHFMAPVWHCDPLVGEGGAGCFDFLWSMACVLSVMVWLLFFLLPLVGYDL